MIGITEISAVVAAAGVLIGVIYYIIDLRFQTKLRKTDLFVRLCEEIHDKDWLEAWDLVNKSQTADLYARSSLVFIK